MSFSVSAPSPKNYRNTVSQNTLLIAFLEYTTAPTQVITFVNFFNYRINVKFLLNFQILDLTFKFIS